MKIYIKDWEIDIGLVIITLACLFVAGNMIFFIYKIYSSLPDEYSVKPTTNYQRVITYNECTNTIRATVRRNMPNADYYMVEDAIVRNCSKYK